MTIISGDVPADKPKCEQITLVLIDNGNDSRPMACRVKQWVKLGLRGFHLRLVECTGLDSLEVAE